MKKDFFNVLKYFWLPAAVFVFSLILDFAGIYDSIPRIDVPMHFAGGVAVGVSFFFTINYFEQARFIKLNNLTRIIFVVSLVSLIAVFWEFYEFIFDYLFGFDWQLSLEDTLLDLFLGIAGGFLTGIFLAFKNRDNFC